MPKLKPPNSTPLQPGYPGEAPAKPAKKKASRKKSKSKPTASSSERDLMQKMTKVGY